jgi:hypothetical protein
MIWSMRVPIVETDWWADCPRCGREAPCKLRPDTKLYAELWCWHCLHIHWLEKPKREEHPMSTAMMDGTTYDPWSMEVKTAGGGEYELCPAGNYPACICAMIDVGNHDANDKDGKPYQRRQLVLAFELAKKRKDGTPFVLAERYTWSMSNNSHFYTLATNLTGAKREGERFDPRVLLGKFVMVQVTNNESTKNGKTKTYHNVGAVAQFPEGLPTPQSVRTPVAWSVMQDEPPPDTGWLPYVYGESVAKMIENSHEFRAGRVPKSAAHATAIAAGKDDDIPF